VKAGVLALQGAVVEHQQALRDCGAEPLLVRTPADLRAADCLILPGGESTTIGKLLERFDLLDPIRTRAAQGMPVWGTCAGLILLAREVTAGLPGQPLLGLLDAQVERNAFGRQVDSFEASLEVPVLGPEPFPAVLFGRPWPPGWDRRWRCWPATTARRWRCARIACWGRAFIQS
jgi:5'-phosphate synthase pdxT subunit